MSLTKLLREHLAMIQVVNDTKVWWDCYEAIWEQLNYMHAIKCSLPRGFSMPHILIALDVQLPEPNIEAFVDWPNWAAIIHSCLEELVGHQWASLGVEPLPQDSEVPEREKSQSCDIPVIGEGLWDVGQSIEKGKGKQIACCNGSHHPNPNPYLIQHCASPL
ncbi:hypothetical protein EDC04DRAFT_2603684 [Pisolithus marmoratus]|nr:hypothetical protein EDC04DRAFT_2603684 [Pisolithus marmoratus]